MSDSELLPLPVDAGTVSTVGVPAHWLQLSSEIRAAKNVDAALHLMPCSLDGHAGRYRGAPEANIIGANTDLKAIAIWIKARAGTVHTRRLYKREANRFLIWALSYKHKALADITVEDVVDFHDWLARSEVSPYWPKHWRVFSGKPLSADSRTLAMNVLQGLYTYLHATGYLNANPFLAVKTGQAEADVQARLGGNSLARTEEAPLERYFEQELWEWLLTRLDRPYSPHDWPDYEQVINPDGDELTDEEQKAKRKSDFIRGRKQTIIHSWSPERIERLRFIIIFGYRTAARRSELAAANMSQIQPVKKMRQKYWVWVVTHAKGSKSLKKLPHLPLGDAELSALKRYRLFRNLTPLPEKREPDVPLIERLKDETKRQAAGTRFFITDAQLNHEIKMFMTQSATAVLDEGKPADWGDYLRAASAHWLRHSFGSHSAARGIALEYTATRMRHKHESTTRKYYVHLPIEDQLEQLRKLDTTPSSDIEPQKRSTP